MSGRRFGPAMALVLSSGLSGCGLEMIPALPLLFPLSRVDHVPPEPAFTGSPHGTKHQPLFIASADKTSRVADQLAGPPNQNATKTTSSAQPIGPTAVAVAADETLIYEIAPRECNCVGLTCRQPIETCGQLWAPYYDPSLPKPDLFLSEPYKTLAR